MRMEWKQAKRVERVSATNPSVLLLPFRSIFGVSDWSVFPSTVELILFQFADAYPRSPPYR